jgi:hypothetical protein
MAFVRQAQIRLGKHPWVTKVLDRMSAKQAAIAIANKTTRIAWAIMVRGGVYEVGHRAPQYRAEACAAAGSKMLGDGVIAVTCGARLQRQSEHVCGGADGMMVIGRSSRRENLLRVTGVEPRVLIRTHLANHIRASSREKAAQTGQIQSAPDRNRHHTKSTLDAGAPSTHDSNERQP